jgi:hypothetical protein
VKDSEHLTPSMSKYKEYLPLLEENWFTTL